MYNKTSKKEEAKQKKAMAELEAKAKLFLDEYKVLSNKYELKHVALIDFNNMTGAVPILRVQPVSKPQAVEPAK